MHKAQATAAQTAMETAGKEDNKDRDSGVGSENALGQNIKRNRLK